MLPPLLPLVTWLALLIRYPKRTLAIATPLFTLLLIFAVWIQWQENNTQKRLAQLIFTLDYAPQHCPADRPLHLQLHNSTDLSLQELRWQIAAYRPGERLNLAENRYNDPEYALSKTLAVDEQWQSCLPLPSLRPGYRASTLEFHAEDLQGRFLR